LKVFVVFSVLAEQWFPQSPPLHVQHAWVGPLPHAVFSVVGSVTTALLEHFWQGASLVLGLSLSSATSMTAPPLQPGFLQSPGASVDAGILLSSLTELPPEHFLHSPGS